jgi:drug/metabolite transporter (DMT)-like permease
LATRLINWLLFLALSLIWGSSFILMKEGLKALTPYQVATLRLLSAGIILLPFALKAYRAIERDKLKYVLLSALTGSFFPAYLYCIAETKIDSSLAAVLNSLTPLCTILLGIAFFNIKVGRKKLLGVFTGLAGLVLLPFAANKGISVTGLSYSALVLLATVLYAVNGNIAAIHFSGTKALYITSMAFAFLIIPCLLILYATGFFSIHFGGNRQAVFSTLASVVLGVGGSALAYILFYMLVKRAGPIFTSLVTYGIPFVAIVWGMLDGEVVTLAETGCLLIILAGVYLANKK